MSTRVCSAAFAASVALALATGTPALAQRPAEASSWVWRDHASGRLLYRTTPVGDRIPDFSGTGYLGGAQPVPDADAIIPAARRFTVAPTQGDATQAIQRAIDRVAALAPDASGFRGLVQLQPGTYDIEDSIRIEASGILLRGTTATKLRGTGTAQRSLIVVGRRKSTPEEVPGTRSDVADAYVPVGATSLRVSEPQQFRAGMEVIVLRPATAAWISAIGMDRLPSHEDGKRLNQWRPSRLFDQRYERRVAHVEGDRLFLDAPLPTSLDRALGPAVVYRYVFPERIERIGLIELHGEAVYDPSVKDGGGREIDEAHAWSFIDVDCARNAWIERVSARHFGFAAVILRPQASQVTVRDAKSLAPVSRITGGRRYAFSNDGQRNLLHDLYSEYGRHDFVNNVPSRGPNVFLHGRAVHSLGESGPHQRWSTGTLYDHIDVAGPRASLAAYNAGRRGTGHGHSGANMVFWNSSAARLRIENPPTAQNWAIGNRGEAIDPDDFLRTPTGTYDRHGAPAGVGDAARDPQNSLFLMQQADRVRNGVRRSYPAGEHSAGADTRADGSAQLTLPIPHGPGEAPESAVVRFAMRRGSAGATGLTIGREPLRAALANNESESRDVVTGTAVVPAAAVRQLARQTAVVIGGDSGLRLLWAEIEVDFMRAGVAPAQRRPSTREPALETR